MKRRILSLVLCLALLCTCNASAQDAAQGTVEDVLAVAGTILRERDVADVLDVQTVHAMLEALRSAGYAAPESLAEEGPAFPYDFLLDLCEANGGSYQKWSIAERHAFDRLMVDIGQLSCCFNLLPGENEISGQAALSLASAAVMERFGAPSVQEGMTAVFYSRLDQQEPKGSWRFAFDVEGGTRYTVYVHDGRVTHCAQAPAVSELDAAYEALCEEKGAFFTWPLEDKVNYAASLPQKLTIARASGEEPRNAKDLNAIAQQGFCLPDAGAIRQEEAYRLAAEAVTEQYGLSDTWNQDGETYASYFRGKRKGDVWRVIFWKTGNPAFPGGVVELDAQTGEILRVEMSGTTPGTAIPYIERL